jgi:hypothetical protein
MASNSKVNLTWDNGNVNMSGERKSFRYRDARQQAIKGQRNSPRIENIALVLANQRQVIEFSYLGL